MSFHCHRCERDFPDVVNEGLHSICSECVKPGDVLKWEIIDGVLHVLVRGAPLKRIVVAMTIGETATFERYIGEPITDELRHEIDRDMRELEAR